MLQRTSVPSGDPARSPVICVTGLRGFPHVMGGIESHCEELLPRIKTLWPDHRSVVLGRAPYLPERQGEHRGVEIIGIPCPRSQHFEAVVSTFLSVLSARKRGARLIHIHAIGPGLLAPVAPNGAFSRAARCVPVSGLRSLSRTASSPSHRRSPNSCATTFRSGRRRFPISRTARPTCRTMPTPRSSSNGWGSRAMISSSPLPASSPKRACTT